MFKDPETEKGGICLVNIRRKSILEEDHGIMVIGVQLLLLLVAITSRSVLGDENEIIELQRFLGPRTDVDEFFQDYFDKKPLLIELDERMGDGRAEWLRTYRTFIREDLDKMLSRNISAVGHESLALGRDLVLEKPLQRSDGVWEMHEVVNFWPHVESNHSVPLKMVHGMFQDGLSLRIMNMEYRSRTILETVANFETLFGSPSDADLIFVPQGWEQEYENEATAHYSAIDRFIVQLDGHQSVQISQPVITRPLRHLEFEIDPNTELKSAMKDAILTEGDVLYVPRGYVLSSLTDATQPSMHLVFKTQTYRHGYSNVISRMLDCCVSCEKVGKMMASAVTNSKYLFWGDIIQSAIRVGADVAENLRELYPVSPLVLKIFERQNSRFNTAEEIRKRTSAFLKATKDVFFEPFIQTLEQDGMFYGSEEIVDWSKSAKEEDKETFEAIMSSLEECLNFEQGDENFRKITADSSMTDELRVEAMKIVAEHEKPFEYEVPDDEETPKGEDDGPSVEIADDEDSEKEPTTENDSEGDREKVEEASAGSEEPVDVPSSQDRVEEDVQDHVVEEKGEDESDEGDLTTEDDSEIDAEEKVEL